LRRFGEYHARTIADNDQHNKVTEHWLNHQVADKLPKAACRIEKEQRFGFAESIYCALVVRDDEGLYKLEKTLVHPQCSKQKNCYTSAEKKLTHYA